MWVSVDFEIVDGKFGVHVNASMAVIQAIESSDLFFRIVYSQGMIHFLAFDTMYTYSA